MPTIASDSLPLGHTLPSFSLPDVVEGTVVSDQNVCASKALLISFLCRHCPYVVHIREALMQLAADYQPRGTIFLGISSNDPEQYSDDAPEKLREMAMNCGFSFPLLFDETQQVARAFTATCTPDFFLFDSQSKLAYHGRLDDSTPGNGRPLTGKDLRNALDAVLAAQPVPGTQLPSMGCGIKWKAKPV